MKIGNVALSGMVLLLAGALNACGQEVETAEAKTENAPETQVTGEESTAASATPSASTAAAETAAASAPAPAATVAALPLKRGYYVTSDKPCNQASRADVAMLLTRTGTNLNCTFKKIEKTGATTYKVTEECVHDGSSWGREDVIETFTGTYEIPNETSYKVTYEGGGESSARYCAQSSMSPGYRDNDISDITR